MLIMDLTVAINRQTKNNNSKKYHKKNGPVFLKKY